MNDLVKKEEETEQSSGMEQQTKGVGYEKKIEGINRVVIYDNTLF